jgi:hypothetical protein
MPVDPAPAPTLPIPPPHWRKLSFATGAAVTVLALVALRYFTG